MSGTSLVKLHNVCRWTAAPRRPTSIFPDLRRVYKEIVIVSAIR